ncbi:MAG TPA: hypothetical protein VGV38_18440 [Pyrinomonadaceae bacterium]|nr:hypothetical protein [Pyrinomonadaceae bacterium]
MVGTPLLAVGLFAFTFVMLSRTRRELGDVGNMTRQSFSSLKHKQEDLSRRLETLSAADSDLYSRLAELSADIGAVNTRVQGIRAAAGAPAAVAAAPPDGYGVAARQPEPPAFPVSVEAYLRKMQRYAQVVRPDFQNGILVLDPENRAELVVVADASVSHDSLFLVPRASQFQTKQDFYTYYERYYDCERPTSGTVWIVDPAVVVRVQGGWELREKGLLEVR